MKLQSQLVFLLVVTCWFLPSRIAADSRPNVLLILTDDQRWDAIGLGGSKHLKTPNMDRLGAEGVYFKNSFCTTSLCSPSRASILSGLNGFDRTNLPPMCFGPKAQSFT